MAKKVQRKSPIKAKDLVYLFKVTLKDIEPPIWRGILVPGNYSFWDLHVAIQDAMGWLDYHLHAFNVRNPATGENDLIGIPDDDGFLGDPEFLPGWKIPLRKEILPSKRRPPLYRPSETGLLWIYQRWSLVLKKELRKPVFFGGVNCPPISR